jgi:hypothetical protein
MRIISFILFVTISAIACCSKSYAQANHPGNAVEKLYVIAGGGFGFGAAGASAQAGDYTTAYSNSGSNAIVTNVVRSKLFNFGKGLNFDIGGGVFVSKNISAELNLAYLSGAANASTYVNSYSNGTSENGKSSLKASMVRIVPGLRLQFGEKKLHPYMRAGLIIGVAGKIEEDMIANLPSLTYTSTKIYSKGISWGFLCGVGARYSINKRLDVFGELTQILQTWAPSRSDITKETQNGKNTQGNLTTSQKETLYSSNYSTTAVNHQLPPDKPITAMSVYFPLSSIGFTLGIHLKFYKIFVSDKSKYNLG